MESGWVDFLQGADSEERSVEHDNVDSAQGLGHSESGWLDFLQGPDSQEQHVEHDDIHAPQGLGRPQGLHGSHMYRAALRAQEQAEAEQMPQVRHTVEHARAALQIKRQTDAESARVEQRQTEQLQLQVSTSGSDLQQAMAQQIMAKALSDPLNDNQNHIARSLLQEVSRSVTSKKAEAERLDTTAKTLSRQYSQCAAGVINYAGLLWEQMLVLLMHLCSSGKYQPLSFVVKRRYDETPSRIRVPFPAGGGGTGKERNTLAKILQSELQITVVLQEGSPESGRCVLLTGHAPTWLQAIDRNTAECIKHCQRQLEAVIPKLHAISAMFKLPVPSAMIGMVY